MRIGKKSSSYRGAYRVPLFALYICLCLCICNIRLFYRLRELCEADFHKPGIYGSGGECGLTRGTCFIATPSRGGRGRRAVVDFVACFECGGIFLCFFFPRFRTHTACCKYESTQGLIYLSNRNKEATQIRGSNHIIPSIGAHVQQQCMAVISCSTSSSWQP